MNRQCDDESVLVDYLLGRCEPAQGEQIRARLQGEQDFRRRHDNVNNVLAALGLLPRYEAPDHLVEATLGRIRQRRQTEELLAREGLRPAAPRRRFYLRDLATAAAVIAIAALVLGPTLRRQSQLALRGLCESQTAQIGRALQAYASANADFLPTARPGPQQWLPSNAGGNASNSEGLFRLVVHGYAPVVVFRCPAVGGQKPAPLAVKPGMADFPGGDYVSYSYQYTLGPGGLRLSAGPVAKVAANMAILADSSPVFQGGRFNPHRVHDDASDNHARAGQNVLYLDSHVAWSTGASAGVKGDNIFLAEGIYDYRGDEKPAGPTDSFLLPAYSAR